MGLKTESPLINPCISNWKQSRCSNCCCEVRLTVGEVAVGSRVDGVAEGELDLLVAGEVERVGGAGAHRQHVDAPDGPPHALGPHDLPQRVHHVPVASARLRVEALHPGLRQRWRRRQRRG